jgi:predicted nuclease of predicted toxin-antitoxin system
MDIHFHLDENIHGGVANGLARRGIDVITTQASGLLGAADQTQLEFATSAGRVLVTHDSDHLALAAGGVHHAGIAYRHPENCSVGDMVHALTELWRTRTAEEMIDQIAFLPRRPEKQA